LERLEEELLEINASTTSLRKDYTELNEMLEVIDRVQQFMNEGRSEAARQTILDVQQGIAGPISNVDIGEDDEIPKIKRIDDKKDDNELRFYIFASFSLLYQMLTADTVVRLSSSSAILTIHATISD
uniref:SKA2 domain-containing protein n=1 Tax=Anisakis simplex TaxID=6269 RepID=A0A0M3JII6_ANISI